MADNKLILLNNCYICNNVSNHLKVLLFLSGIIGLL